MANLHIIKTELFFIKRLLQEGYGPKYWWSYAKNRFFGNYLFTRLPRCDYAADSDFELHTICSRHGQGLWMFAWMLNSFLYNSGLKPMVIIHDDGTLDKKTAELIKDKFPNTKIMFRSETARQILEMPDVPDIVKKARKEGHFFLDRLLNIMIFSKAKKIIVTDVDILYYKLPAEIVDFISGRSEFDALAQRQINEDIIMDMRMDESYSRKYKIEEKKVALMNGGYTLYNKEKLNLGQLSEYLEHTSRPLSDYFIEMIGWACILAQLNFKFLSPERYAIKGFLNDKMVMKHYTSPRRYEMFAYGIDKAREKIENGK